MKKLLFIAFSLCALVVMETSVQAQFRSGKSLLGPQIGLSQYGSTITIGGMFEVPVNKPGDLGPGIVGVSGQISYFHYEYLSGSGVSWVLLGAYGNYHFVLENNRTLDPFVGLGLNYAYVSTDGVGYGYGSSIYLGIQGGLRYFFSPNVAGRVMLGNIGSFLTLGVDFAI